MAQTKIPSRDILSQGVHLFHLGPSNCSRRVRIALAEKNVSWISHIVDLARYEHADPAYLALNPKGVIPTLVHDGVVIVESNDIIQYIDNCFTGPELIPTDAADREYVFAAMNITGDIQHHIKAITYQWRLRPFVSYSAAQITAFECAHPNTELVDFIRDYSADGPAWQDRVKRADTRVCALLAQLEDRLGQRPWLSGERFGLADISWFAHIIHLQDANYDISDFPTVLDWVDRLKARESYQSAVNGWLAIPTLP